MHASATFITNCVTGQSSFTKDPRLITYYFKSKLHACMPLCDNILAIMDHVYKMDTLTCTCIFDEMWFHVYIMPYYFKSKLHACMPLCD